MPEHIVITERYSDGDASTMTWPNSNTTRWKQLRFRITTLLHVGTKDQEMTISRQDACGLLSIFEAYEAALLLEDAQVRHALAGVIVGPTQKSEGFDDPDE